MTGVPGMSRRTIFGIDPMSPSHQIKSKLTGQGEAGATSRTYVIYLRAKITRPDF